MATKKTKAKRKKTSKRLSRKPTLKRSEMDSLMMEQALTSERLVGRLEEALAILSTKLGEFIETSDTKLCLVWGTAVVNTDGIVPALSLIEETVLQFGEKSLSDNSALAEFPKLRDALCATSIDAQAKEERRKTLKSGEHIVNLAAAPALMTIGKQAEFRINPQNPGER